MHHHLPPSILAATTAALLLLSAASSSAFFVSALPCPRDEAATDSSCLDASTAGLTAWADADFSGPSYQYNVSWNTCTSIAADFPLNQAAGVSSLAANAYNWCTVYPNTNCSAGQGRANDTLDVVGSYYDLADPEEAWDNLPQSFSCRPYGCE